MIVLALGANLPSVIGPPEVTIRAALDALGERGAKVHAVSHLWRTPAWPDPRDPSFVNAVATIATALTPQALLGLLHDIEAQFGRDRVAVGERNAPRTLDLDLIDYNGLVQAGPPELPHPRMGERAFVLIPLREIAPAWHHPVSGKGIDDLIADLPSGNLKEISRLD